MSFSIPYIILIFTLCILSFLYDNMHEYSYKNRISGIAIMLFVFFFGFRGFILSDWIIYYPYFYDCEVSNIINITNKTGSWIEPGYTILNLICKLIYPDYQFFVLICCILQLALLLHFFKNRITNIPMALMIYIVFEGLVISTNLMRNSFAIFIFMNAIPYLLARKPLQYFSLCLLALTFHASAIIYFPLYFIFHKTCNRWLYLIIFIISNLVFLLHISVVTYLLSLVGIDESLTMKVRAYTEIYDQRSMLSIGYIERLMTGILVFLYYHELKSIRKENGIFINAVITYLTIYFSFSEFAILSKRIATLFVFGYWIIWIDLIRCFFYENNKKLFVAFIYLYCILRIGSSTRLPDFKYDNFFLGMQSYQERLYYHNKTYEGI